MCSELNKMHAGEDKLDKFVDRMTPLQFALFGWWWIGWVLPLYHLGCLVLCKVFRRG